MKLNKKIFTNPRWWITLPLNILFLIVFFVYESTVKFIEWVGSKISDLAYLLSIKNNGSTHKSLDKLYAWVKKGEREK